MLFIIRTFWQNYDCFRAKLQIYRIRGISLSQYEICKETEGMNTRGDDKFKPKQTAAENVRS